MNDTYKISALRQFIELQKEDDTVWFKAQTATEAYLQNVISFMGWLIEEATVDEIISKTEIYRKDVLLNKKTSH